MDINDDFILSCFGEGFKIIKSSSPNRISNRSAVFTVKEVLQNAFSVFFVDRYHRLQRLNAANARLCGFDSERAAIGKLASDFATKCSAICAIESDKATFLSRRTQITEQTLTRIDENHSDLLTIRTPLFDDQNKLIGLLGCAINIGKDSLANALFRIAQLGLLSTSSFGNQFIGSDVNEVYLSKRQFTCAKLLLTGMRIKEIAAYLQLSPRTIETYIEQLKIKFNCPNKTELILKLSEHISAH